VKILLACEESQRVCLAFRELGHDSFSCDIKPCSGGHPEWHIKGDVSEILKEKWDMIIGFPPCTYMCVGSAVRMYPTSGVICPDRYAKAMQARDFFMSIYNAKCPRIAVENPVPLKCVGLPAHTQVIQPYQFGDPYSKKTCLWLRGLPKLKPTNICTEYQPYINGGGGRLNKKNYKNKTFASGSTTRSKTFSGIAAAMAEQWGSVDTPISTHPVQLRLFT
jgi:hypothetical protein